MIFKAQTEGYKAFAPQPEAIADFVEHADEFLKRMIWSGKCKSWFKNGKSGTSFHRLRADEAQVPLTALFRYTREVVSTGSTLLCNRGTRTGVGHLFGRIDSRTLGMGTRHGSRIQIMT